MGRTRRRPQPDQTIPDSGGPGGDNGVIAVPKKKEAPEDVPPPAPAPAAPKMKNPEGLGNVSLRLDVPEVTVDVGVLLEKTHQFVPGLKPDNFRVYEDGVEQKVIGFKRVEAPITALLLCEFAANSYYFIYDMRNAAWAFAQQLRPQDYVAHDDLRHAHADHHGLYPGQEADSAGRSTRCVIPGFRETNVFDALYEGLDRLQTHRGAQIHHPDLHRAGHVLKADVRQDSEEGEGLAGHHDLYRFDRRDGARDD